ncbi:MAG: helix-turn-helix transcriptional regulator [Anaerotignum propionicum]|nr:helix-turn-helix transcriptional regulator [Anaerotignum propionicum]MEA5056455.1 helix-turn-helix transcriptional regulator [Anaerotignum propionicum]
MDISEAIKQIRTSLGLSQMIFAQKLHVSFSTVNRWENGKVTPNRLATVAIIAFAREYNVDEVLLENLKGLYCF